MEEARAAEAGEPGHVGDQAALRADRVGASLQCHVLGVTGDISITPPKAFWLQRKGWAAGCTGEDLACYVDKHAPYLEAFTIALLAGTLCLAEPADLSMSERAYFVLFRSPAKPNCKNRLQGWLVHCGGASLRNCHEGFCQAEVVRLVDFKQPVARQNVQLGSAKKSVPGRDKSLSAHDVN